MFHKVFLIWKADNHRGEYLPIASLEKKEKYYIFRYTEGIKRAQEVGYVLLPEFPDIYKVYKSEDLFPVFSNRLMSKSRRNYNEYLELFSLPGKSEKLQELAFTSGKRATDRYRIISMPITKRNKAELIFFATGHTRHPVKKEIIEKINIGDQLFLTPMVQNKYDSNAIMLHTKDNEFVGWVPAHYASEINSLLLKNPSDFYCEAVKIYYPQKLTPDILLVKLTFACPKEWHAFKSGYYQPVTKKDQKMAM